MSRILAAILFVCIVALGGIHGFPAQSLVSLLLLLALLLTALPAARLLFADPAEALLFAFPLGYILHSVLLALLSLAAPMSAVTILAYLVVAVCLARPWRFFPTTAVECAPLVWMLAAVAVCSLPLAKIGAATDGGGFAYRAYFNADFFKHLGITAALANTGIPPANPYLSGHLLHYYWFFYVIPAYWTKILPSYPLQYMLVQFTLVGSLSFVGCLHVALRRLIGSGRMVPYLALLLLLFAGSFEGIYGIHRLYLQHQDWRAFTTLNVDGLTRWYWQTPQVDTLYRALLYTPQHLLAVCILLLWLTARKQPMTRVALAVFYSAIFATLGFAAIIGALFIFTVVVFAVIDFARAPSRKWKEIALAAGLGVAFLVLYFPVFRQFQAGGQLMKIGLVARIWEHLPGYLVLNWGAILFLGVAGILWSPRGFPRPTLCFLLLSSLLCMHFVQDNVGGSEVTLKLGYLVDLCFLLFSAGFLDRLIGAFQGKRAAVITAAAVTILLVLPASVTWWIDFINSQDVSNTRFTTYVSGGDALALDWMRKNLPADAVVQNDALEGQNQRVSLVPCFGERSVYLGDRFHARAFQVSADEVKERERVVTALFRAPSAQAAAAIAGESGIGYLFLSSSDAREIGNLRSRFPPPYFSTLVEGEDGAALLRVNAAEQAGGPPPPAESGKR